MAAVIVMDFVQEAADEVGTFRAWTNHAHVAPQDVEKLGKFVEASAAKPSADVRAAGVILYRPLCVSLTGLCDAHGAGLVHLEALPVEAHSFLPEQDRAK